MILVTHAVGGAAASLLLKTHPVLGFFAGFASHFVLDAIPHYIYPLSSITKDESDPITHDHMVLQGRRFKIDLLKTGVDFGLGLVITALAIRHAGSDLLYPALIGAVGGVAPDTLHLAYYIFPHSFLRHIEKFHLWIHGGPPHHIQNRPVIGIVSQLLILLTFTAVLYLS